MMPSRLVLMHGTNIKRGAESYFRYIGGHLSLMGLHISEILLAVHDPVHDHG